MRQAHCRYLCLQKALDSLQETDCLQKRDSSEYWRIISYTSYTFVIPLSNHHIFCFSGHVKLEDLFIYSDNKKNYINDKNLKKSHFREAVDQIEAAVGGDDSGPLQVNLKIKKKYLKILIN